MIKNNKHSEQISVSVEKCFEHIFTSVSPKPTTMNDLGEVSCGMIPENDLDLKLPSTVFWKITSKCNLRCKHCFYANYEYKFDDKNDLSSKDLFNLAEFFVEEVKVRNFVITGGEPFLKEGIWDVLEYLTSKKVHIKLITNATLINEQSALRLKQLLSNSKSSFIVSLDGVTAEVHDKIRGKGNFIKTINGIQNLVKNNIDISLCFTATSTNLQEIPKLYDFCINNNVNKLVIGRYKPFSEEQEYLTPEIDAIFIIIASLLDKIKNSEIFDLNLLAIKPYDFLNFKIGQKLLDKYLESNNISVCENLMCHNHQKITVSGDGKIYLCLDTEKEELCLGDLKETSFFEIWENRFSNVFFQERSLKNSICKSCKYIALCGAGCPANAYNAYGDINAPDGECLLGKTLMAKS